MEFAQRLRAAVSRTDSDELTFSPGLARALVFGGLLIAAVLLGHDINRSLWYDESATYQFATYPWADLWHAVHLADAFYFVYYAFLHVWLSVFGHSEIVLRTPSLVFALATLPIMFRLVRRLVSTECAIVAVALLTLNAYFFEYASEARPYSFLVFAAALLSLLVVHTSERGAPRSLWFWYAGAAAIAINLQFFTIFVLAAHCAYFIAVREWRNLGKAVAAGAFVGLTAMPMLALALHDSASQNGFLGKFSLKQIPTVLGTFAGSKMLWRVNVGFALLGVVLGLLQKRGKAVAFFTCGAVVPVIAMLILSTQRPLFAPRYLIELLPSYIALSAIGVVSLGRLRYIAAIIYIALTGYVFAHLERRVPENWPAVAHKLAADPAPVVFFPRIGIESLAYYLPEVRTRTLYPTDQRLENITYFQDFPERTAASIATKNKHIFVIVEYLDAKVPNDLEGVVHMKQVIEKYYSPVHIDEFSKLEVIDYRRK